MTQQPTRPDLFLERDSTRSVNTFDVAAAGSETMSRIRVEPTDASVTARSGSQRDGGAVRVHNEQGDTVSRLDSRDGSGRVELRDENATRTVTLGSNRDGGELLVLNDRAVTAALTSEQQRGRVEINDRDGENRVLAAVSSIQNEQGAGLLELKNSDGYTTIRLRGRDGVLELQNPPDGADEDDLIDFEGGDLVLQDWWDEGERDIYVHATGNDDSVYGVQDGNRPRIFLDGRNATVELGREELGDNREAVAGRIRLRFGYGTGDNTTLDAKTRKTGASNQDRASEISLHLNENGVLNRKGTVASSASGVTVADATGATAMLVDTMGTVTTAQRINEESIPKEGPRYVGYVVVVTRGDTAAYEFTLGDDATTTVRFGDEATTGYELRGTVQADPDVTTTVGFDTGAAGDPNAQTVSIDGDVIWNQQYETTLNGALPTGDYDFVIEGATSGRTARGVLTVE